MWIHEESIETRADPARVWELLADVARWKEWNAGIEMIELHGPFADGGTFTMKPPGEQAFTSTLAAVRELVGFADETWIGETCVRVDHRLVQLPSGGTRITYCTEIVGPDEATLGPMVTGDFGDVLRALRQRAEHQSAALAVALP